jgi:hypothetical protein
MGCSCGAKWEYRVCFIGDPGQDKPEATERLNTEGAEGWELVGINDGDFGVYGYFKRPKSTLNEDMATMRAVSGVNESDPNHGEW